MTRRDAIGFGVTLLVLIATPCRAQCTASSRSLGQTVGYTKIQVKQVGVPQDLQDDVADAYGDWNDPDCNDNGNSFPFFQSNAEAGARQIEVVYHSGANPSNNQVCAEFGGNTIDVYSTARVNGIFRPCTKPNEFRDTMAHEFGHVLGLQHVSDSNCPHHSMTSRQVTASAPIPINGPRRRVQQGRCHQQDRR